MSGRRERAFRKRRLSLMARARILAGRRRQPPFKKRLHPERSYLKRRL